MLADSGEARWGEEVAPTVNPGSIDVVGQLGTQVWPELGVLPFWPKLGVLPFWPRVRGVTILAKARGVTILAKGSGCYHSGQGFGVLGFGVLGFGVLGFGVLGFWPEFGVLLFWPEFGVLLFWPKVRGNVRGWFRVGQINFVFFCLLLFAKRNLCATGNHW